MKLVSPVVVCLDHETGKMWIDWDTTDARFNDGAVIDTESNEWHTTSIDDIPEDCAERDAELCGSLDALLKGSNVAQNLLEEVYEDCRVGDGLLQDETWERVMKYFESDFKGIKGE
jgi:hypothetical protein